VFFLIGFWGGNGGGDTVRGAVVLGKPGARKGCGGWWFWGAESVERERGAVVSESGGFGERERGIGVWSGGFGERGSS